nr:oxygen-independent coproporphyrinogen III oxidase [Litoreibacter ponti]
MDKIDALRRHGLFDARVPRYTSYPPANHFEAGVGHRYHAQWLDAVPEGEAVSLYVHIPFCRRLCWFCACRTQGTKTMRPVDAYVETLTQEIAEVRARLNGAPKMARLHLGGGTPTILPPHTMTLLLATIFSHFEPARGFEFSVEIDPTDASDALLETLLRFGMNRASIGVQDFAPEVQKAIGRPQSVEQTAKVVEFLRARGTPSINFDLLYGLPHQTSDSFQATLDHVIKMAPDRLAIYGYAHVPWMSKRQVMIDEATLPDKRARLQLAEQAHDAFVAVGYEAIGIDHFARPSDTLAIAAANGTLKRNFQGYTDDPGDTLLGFGASAISKFREGYVQNAPATSAYIERVGEGGLAGFKGYQMSRHDQLIARMIEDLMCRFTLNEGDLALAFPGDKALIHKTLVALMRQFEDVFYISEAGLALRDDARPLVRIIASAIDQFANTGTAHSTAI